MEKISLLIYSRNDPAKTMDLIKELYGFVDEVILVDSSDPEYRKVFQDKGAGLSRLRIFHTIALGGVEPYMPYAHKRCRYDWVLRLDTDESINEKFKKNLRQIITNAKCDAFFIKRFENVVGDKKTNGFSMQLRLYKKEKVKFSGVFDQLPMIDGKIEVLADKYYMNHMSEVIWKQKREYHRLKFVRFSYGTFNSNLENYLLNPNFPKNTLKKAFGRAVISLMLLSEKIRGKEMEEEISSFDYFIGFIIVVGGYVIMGKDLYGILHLVPNGLAYVGEINRWKQDPDSEEIFEITKIIRKVGTIRFLNLDDDKTMEIINRKYAKEKQGVALLTKLLKERYEKGKNYLR